MTNTPTPIDTLEFWQTVQEEFTQSKETWLCTGSPTFKSIYNHEQTALHILAEQFLEETDNRYFEVGNVYLFCPAAVLKQFTDTQRRQVRFEFINWNIQRLSKPN